MKDADVVEQSSRAVGVQFKYFSVSHLSFQTSEQTIVTIDKLVRSSSFVSVMYIVVCFSEGE